MDKQKLIDKTKSLGCLGLLLVLLMAASCKTGHHGDPAVITKAQNEASYTLATLPFDENEQAFFRSRYQKKVLVDDFPDWEGIIKVDAITDKHARFTFFSSPIEEIPAKYLGRSYHYSIYILNEEGQYESLESLTIFNMGSSIERSPRQPLHLSRNDFKPNTTYTVRMFIEFTDDEGRPCSTYDRHVVRFKTKAYPPKPKGIYFKYTDEDHPATLRSLIELTSLVGPPAAVTLRISEYWWTNHARYTMARFFADAACTELVGETSTWMYEANPLGKFPYYQLTLDEPLPLGKHRFYATLVNELGNSSPCSTAYASYTAVECPEDYVVVQPDPELNLPAFCLMKTEARRGANDVAVPGYSEYPWETTPQEAKDACRRVAPNCDLITNLEWMATAKQIESFIGNWANKKLETGNNNYLTKGNTVNASGVLNISNPSNAFDQLPNNNFNHRRTFKLLMGTLWDFGGNLAEWADNAEVGGEVFQPITNTCDQGPFELLDPEFSCADLDPRYYTPWTTRESLKGNAYQNYTHQNYNIGRIVGPSALDQDSATPLAAARGGQADDEANSGIYSLFMFNHLDDTNGFRCVCHLPE